MLTTAFVETQPDEAAAVVVQLRDDSEEVRKTVRIAEAADDFSLTLRISDDRDG